MTEFGAVGKGFSIHDPEVDQMFQAYSTARSRFYVVEQSREVVGCGGIAQLTGGGPEICELKKMYFLPQARGRGVGRLLTETLLQDAARIGFRKVYIETLESMTAANRLYRRLGFVQLENSLGDTGHCGCDTYYVLEVPPLELDPSLLG
jgi:putative acetyltransferase